MSESRINDEKNAEVQSHLCTTKTNSNATTISFRYLSQLLKALNNKNIIL